MKRETLQKIYDYLFPTAQVIIEEGRQHARMLFTFKVRPNSIERLGIALLAGDPETAGIVVKVAAEACPKDCVCVLVDEGWGKFALDGSPIDETQRVRDMPGRKEMVIMSFFGSDWEASAYSEIKRRPNRLLRGEIMMNAHLDGRLAPH